MGTSAGAPVEDNLIYMPVPNLTKSALKESGTLKISLNEEDILLVHNRDKVHAIDERCPHQGGPLAMGEIEEFPDKTLCIKCPWHSYKFNIVTGDCVFPGHKSNKKLTVFPVKIKKEEIRVGFPSISPKYFQPPP